MNDGIGATHFGCHSPRNPKFSLSLCTLIPVKHLNLIRWIALGVLKYTAEKAFTEKIYYINLLSIDCVMNINTVRPSIVRIETNK